MKTIKLEVELTYDEETMHCDDPYAIAWFNNYVLLGDKLKLHDNGELGDTIGDVKVIKIGE